MAVLAKIVRFLKNECTLMHDENLLTCDSNIVSKYLIG